MMGCMMWVELEPAGGKSFEVLVSDDQHYLHAWILWTPGSVWREVFLPPARQTGRVNLACHGRLLGIFTAARARLSAEIAAGHLRNSAA